MEPQKVTIGGISSALLEQQRIAQMVVQKDLQLSAINDQLQRQITQLKVLQRIGDEVRTLTNGDEALRMIARGIVIELQFDGVIVLFGSLPFRVGVKYGYGDIDENLLRRDPIVQSVCQTGKSLTVIDSLKSNSEEARLGGILKLTSFTVQSLHVRERHYGVFIAGQNDPYHKLTKMDIEFFEIVANAVSIMLESLEMEERKRRIDALKSEFVSIASHQLRTPLSIVKWILKMCLDGDLGALNKEQDEFLRKGYESNERMIALVNDLLSVSRLEEGRMEFDSSPCNLSSMIRRALDQYKILIAEKHLMVETNVTGGEDYTINGDEEKLSMVFTNFIDNAIKFTPCKGTIRVMVERGDGEFSVRVSDTGIGISQEDTGKIFTKFFRTENARRFQTDGNGLGLFIARNIIDKHNGKVEVKSVLGKGTTFTCTLPCA